ncbi:MAG: UvrD-helicase domain-containing protein [Ilumatobacteraceae bacterium]
MGILIPEDFPMSQLRNEEERRVVGALCDQLSDGWLVMPDVGLTGKRDRQADIVIAHRHEGVVVIEVKGHLPIIRDGHWYAHGRPMEPQPFAQARDNAYAVARHLRTVHPDLEHLRVEYAVAFPNAGVISGDLTRDIDLTQVFTSGHVDAIGMAVEDLMHRRSWSSSISDEAFAAIVAALRPNAEFSWDHEARARFARARLEKICAQHVRALERLDVNRRVVVTGSAGTGKTRLVVAWAIRAVNRGERVLVTCFNEPLGAMIGERLPESDRLRVGPFLPLARGFDGMPAIDDPDDSATGEAIQKFWDYTVVGHLQRNWHRITEQFDTIIIDEAQDLSPAWIAQLMQLLDPAGPRRVLMVADESQVVYERGFVLPPADDGWTHCELASNCRNTYEIAQLVRRHLRGAPPPTGGPEALSVSWLQAETEDAAVDHIDAEVERIVDHDGIDAERVLFATFSNATRDGIRDRHAMVPFEERNEHALVCENVRRSKGLEYDYVVLVALPGDNVSDLLLYVGCTRAVSGLTIIGPESVARRLGLAGGDSA